MTDKSHCELLYKSVDFKDLRFCFKARKQRTHKGTYGRVMCICGSNAESTDNDISTAMSGAALLSARAALRTGSGLVRVCTHKENFAPIAASIPEAIFVLYGDSTFEKVAKSHVDTAWSCAEKSFVQKGFDDFEKEIRHSDALLIGCGIGCSENALGLLICALRNASCNLVLDADALNLMAKNPHLWGLLSGEQRKKTVITPHPAEMSRLCGKSVSEILENPIQAAVDFSNQYGVTVLLKDHETVIAQGKTVYINKSGNAGMATAGAGDVLAGILVSMLGNGGLEGLDFAEKVAIGAYLHGVAGDIAAHTLGEHSLIASDIIEGIPKALTGVSE